MMTIFPKLVLWVKVMLFKFVNRFDDIGLFEVKASFIPETRKKPFLASFSIYGENDIYTKEIAKVIDSFRTFLPDFDLIFFVGSDVPSHVVDQLSDRNCQFHIMKRKGVNPKFMFWRFLAADFTNYDAIIFRDVDSLASEREAALVTSWLISGKGFHIIRDHPGHQARIMGGLWGIKPSEFEFSFRKMMTSFKKLNIYGNDQVFLATKVYDVVKLNALIHDQFHVFKEENVVKVSLKKGESFLGERFSNTKQRALDRTELTQRLNN